MTPREPDRFEAKARELVALLGNDARASTLAGYIAAALRAAESSALERAARIARRYSHHAEREIRALIPPAAAPEIPDTCPEEGCVLEENHDGPCNTDVPEPASAPAADSALESMCDCGRHVEGEKYALPAGGHVRAAHVDAPAAEAPIRTVPMMPVDEAADARMDALRAAQPPETSRPIAPAAETGKCGDRADCDATHARIAELEAVIRWALGEEGEFRTREPGEGAFWWRIELRRLAKLAARAAPTVEPTT